MSMFTPGYSLDDDCPDALNIDGGVEGCPEKHVA